MGFGLLVTDQACVIHEPKNSFRLSAFLLTANSLSFRTGMVWLRRQDTTVELQILPACKDNDIYLVTEACTCDLGIRALAGGSDGVR